MGVLWRVLVGLSAVVIVSGVLLVMNGVYSGLGCKACDVTNVYGVIAWGGGVGWRAGVAACGIGVGRWRVEV